MNRKNTLSLRLGAFVSLSLFAFSGGYATADSHKKVDYTKMSAEQLAEHLIFEAKGFEVDDKTQEGTTVRDRLTQDDIQKACSKLKGDPVDSATAEKVTQMAMKSMVYPEGGIKLGDWKKGQELSKNAFGFRVGHNVDDHSKKETGGMCMNCHQLEQATVERSGTLGISLIGYGKTLGNDEDAKKHAYQVIYNPHSLFPCSNMPRFGANGVLTQEKISDLLAYLLDPESPVNK